MSPLVGVLTVVVVAVATLLLGAYGLRFSRTTSNFYVASRTVTPMLNASAIGGEYLSAASFLGVAGLVLAYGVDMLWYPVGWTAGYLLLLVLIAAPLRRSGAYTIPDFAEARLNSPAVRRVATVLVVMIGWLYLLPQLQGAGLTLHTVTGAPAWSGGLVVAGIVLAGVLASGMRSITFVQAFQYWLKLTAIAVPIVFLLLAWRADGTPSLDHDAPAVFPDRTVVSVETDSRVRVGETVTVVADGVVDGQRRAGPTRWDAGTHDVRRGTELVFAKGAPVPVVTGLPAKDNTSWALPSGGSSAPWLPLYTTYSLIVATFLGTMGLPHVLVRFYTNPDGRAARRTTLVVLGLLGLFYVFPAVYGALGRLYAPDLLLTGRTDAVVLELPSRMLPGVGGQVLAALVTAGAFAAFLSTASGLVLSVSGVLAQDVFRRWFRPVAAFRGAAVCATVVPVALAAAVGTTDVAGTVGLAFAVAASTFCPLLVLGIWWRRLTATGALAGLLVGGGCAGFAVLATLLGLPSEGWASALLAQPAAWSVPLTFATMVLGSWFTRSARDDRRTMRLMVRLHTPEQLDLDRGESPS